MYQKPRWKPLLPDELIGTARDHLSEIAADSVATARSAASPSYLCEVALLHSYLSRLLPNEGNGDFAVECLNRASEMVTPHGRLGLYSGLSGFAWTIEHVGAFLKGAGLADEDDDPLAELDNVLLDFLDKPHHIQHFDLISGLVGQGVYFLERLPRPSGKRGLELIFNHLKWQAESSWGGTTWHTSEQLLTTEQAALSPFGYFDLGVAHGIPSVFYLLSALVKADILRDQAQQLIDTTWPWLVARERSPSCLTRFDSKFCPGVPDADSRLGWCYGDLGVGGSLYHSALIQNNHSMRRFALSLIDSTIGRPDEATKVWDGGICHGAFGIAHIYNRAHQSTGLELYRTEAVRWYTRGFSFVQPGSGISGFYNWRHDLTPHTQLDRSFLSGSIGIGLALLAAFTNVDPGWDRLLLLSGRP